MAADASFVRPLALVGAKLTTLIARNIRRPAAEAALHRDKKPTVKPIELCGARKLLNIAATENLGGCDDGLDKNENLRFPKELNGRDGTAIAIGFHNLKLP